MSLPKHPAYQSRVSDWKLFREVAKSGKNFITQYLKKFSTRESQTDFEDRQAITYVPAHAKAILNEVHNSIYQRLVDISRTGGPDSYVAAVAGERGGVDRTGNTMTGYVGRILLRELLITGKVGVYIDKPAQPENITLAEKQNITPYLYYYDAEAILNWTYDSSGTLNSVLLEDNIDDIDPDTGLVKDTIKRYRLIAKTPEGVSVRFFDKDENETSSEVLKLTNLPFIILELQDSLLTDIASYQIALLNAGSADMAYIHKSNVPIYTEQADNMLASFSKPAFDPAAGTTTNTDNKSDGIKVGATYGRRYGKGLERPGFIHPSSEPITASMAKQEQLLAEMRLIINLTIQNLTTARASEASKKQDDRSLESGLSAISLELEFGERYFALVWAEYEGSSEPAKIIYPKIFSLKTESDRQEEAEKLIAIRSTIPSLTFQKAISKQVVTVLLNNKLSSEQITSIFKDIDAANVIVTDPATIKSDHEAGFVGTALASQLRGYPPEEVEKAKADHAERAARIALAQSSAAARGVADLAATDDAKVEKTTSQDPTITDDGSKAVRGEGK